MSNERLAKLEETVRGLEANSLAQTSLIIHLLALVSPDTRQNAIERALYATLTLSEQPGKDRELYQRAASIIDQMVDWPVEAKTN